MKKYIKPELQVINMEPETIIATSDFAISDETTVIQLQDRKRGADWSAYEE
jgi:hypothetical protein